MKNINNDNRLKSVYRTKHREDLISSGFYDGRFKEKVVTDKRFKKPKHKCKLFMLD
jgi:hypothetical protein